MTKVLLAFGLFIVMLLLVALKRAYQELPALELKRRARQENHRAHRLYKAAVYEKELSLFFWVFIGIDAAFIPILITKSLPFWQSFLITLGLLWMSIIWQSLIAIPKVATLLAAWLAPVLAWLLNKLHPFIGRFTKFMDQHAFMPPTRLYQTEDLLELINHQLSETDNRIPREQLEMAIRVLSYNSVCVRDIMTPKRMIKSVDVNDHVGPVLMGELHESGHSRFPVFETKPENYVGTLYLKDILDIKAPEKVKKVMKKDVYYVHEEYPLDKVLQAFLKTKHHLFIVVDKLEDIVGVVTIEDVLEQIIGKPIVDEFDKYEDLRAVAEDRAKQEHEKHTEVVE